MTDCLIYGAYSQKKDHIKNIINPKLKGVSKTYLTQLWNDDEKSVKALDSLLDVFAFAFILRKLTEFKVGRNSLIWCFDTRGARHKFKLNLKKGQYPYVLWKINKDGKETQTILDPFDDFFFQLINQNT